MSLDTIRHNMEYDPVRRTLTCKDCKLQLQILTEGVVGMKSEIYYEKISEENFCALTPSDKASNYEKRDALSCLGVPRDVYGMKILSQLN